MLISASHAEMDKVRDDGLSSISKPRVDPIPMDCVLAAEIQVLFTAFWLSQCHDFMISSCVSQCLDTVLCSMFKQNLGAHVLSTCPLSTSSCGILEYGNLCIANSFLSIFNIQQLASSQYCCTFPQGSYYHNTTDA